MKIRPTLLVRRIMKNMGYESVWTNKYQTMRTVKCYGRGKNLDDALHLALFTLGLEFQIRRTRNRNGTIVQLPL